VGVWRSVCIGHVSIDCLGQIRAGAFTLSFDAGVGVSGGLACSATRAVDDALPVLSIIAIFAVIGAIVSLINQAPIGDFVQQIIEIHVQAAIATIMGACLLRTSGTKMTALMFSGVVMLSVFVATLQFVGFSPAWELRDMLQQKLGLIGDDSINVFLTLRLRAMGLSFSPVHLATQICLMFAACYAWLLSRQQYIRPVTWDWHLALLVFIFFASSVISGNRSPLIGILAFLAFQLFWTQPRLAVAIAIFALPLLFIADDIMATLAEGGLRVARTEDGSSAGRAVLRAYGTQLFLDRPYGYGLTFKSVNYWQDYLYRYLDYENYMAISIHALHNYYLQILNKYGALIFPVAGWVAYQAILRPVLCAGFIPYVAHIYYHNDGPLQGDFMIWFILPMYIMLARTRTATASANLNRK
jgi:small basic protein